MLWFVLRRLGQAAAVMLAALFLAFLMFRYAGDPVNQMVGAETSVERRAELREQLGLNDPPLTQFARYVGGALRLDFGVSYQHKRPVAQMLAERFPATLELALLSTVLSLLLGIPMGVFAGLRKNHPFSRLLMTASLVGVSLPTFIIGILLIYFVGVQMGWRPVQGREGVVELGFWSTSFLTVAGWKSLALPAATLGVYQTTLVMRLTRAEMMEVIGYLGACKHMAVPGQWVTWLCSAMGWACGYFPQFFYILEHVVLCRELSCLPIQETLLQEMFLR